MTHALSLDPPVSTRTCLSLAPRLRHKSLAANGQLFMSIPRAKRLEGGMTFDVASEKRRRGRIRNCLEISRLQMCHLKDAILAKPHAEGLGIVDLDGFWHGFVGSLLDGQFVEQDWSQKQKMVTESVEHGAGKIFGQH